MTRKHGNIKLSENAQRILGTAKRINTQRRVDTMRKNTIAFINDAIEREHATTVITYTRMRFPLVCGWDYDDDVQCAIDCICALYAHDVDGGYAEYDPFVNTLVNAAYPNANVVEWECNDVTIDTQSGYVILHGLRIVIRKTTEHHITMGDNGTMINKFNDTGNTESGMGLIAWIIVTGGIIIGGAILFVMASRFMMSDGGTDLWNAGKLGMTMVMRMV